MSKVICDIKKVKTAIEFSVVDNCTDRKNTYSLDFINAIIKNKKTGRELKHIPVDIFNQFYYSRDLTDSTICRLIAHGINGFSYCTQGTNEFNYNARNMQNSSCIKDKCDFIRMIEPLFSYADLLEKNGSDCTNINVDIPTGYIKWLRKNDLPLNQRTYMDFYYEETTKSLNQTQKNFIKSISTDGDIDTGKVLIANIDIINTLISSAVLSAKKGEVNFCYKIKDIVAFLRDLGDEFVRESISSSATISQNLQILKDKRDKEKEKRIIEKENKIRKIENFYSDELIIVVPKTLKDFTDEGKQQHNCVGSFYHNSIITGKNLIYFIRKKDTSNKSYITCRFNIKEQRTVEYRTKHNYNNYTKKDENFIKEIDEQIRKILSE